MFRRLKSTALHRVEPIVAAARMETPLSDDRMVLVGGMSRSGTTLLATVLDSHPEIVCGAELLPGEMPPASDLIALLNRATELAEGDFSQAGRALRHDGNRPMGLFFTRCFRAGVQEDELRAVLHELSSDGTRGFKSLRDRLGLAQSIIAKRAERENAALYGFKYASAAVNSLWNMLPNGYFVGIVRDPLDVVLSHQKRGFEKSVADICFAWNLYASKYRSFCEAHPERAICIRYEDLVRAPRRTLKQVFDVLPVDLHDQVYSFHTSDSPIHSGHHPNAERLRMTFSADGIGKGRETLPADVVGEIDRLCAAEMQAFGYDNRGFVRRKSGSTDLVRIGKAERIAKQVFFSRKRKFQRPDYEALLGPYLDSHEAMTIGQYVRDPAIEDRKVLIIRHDVDHDIETAVKIAKWEADHGIRTTYCLLHTTWYYGRLEDGQYRHSDLLVESIEKLCELGHEINFHNNLVALALRENVSPFEILEQELEFYDRLGVPVVGTSTHGDALCRELEFRNWELFQECCDERFGGPRTVEPPEGFGGRAVELGAVSMHKFGLEYEAYDIGRDIYHTDSGGNMRVRNDTRGRRMFGREEGRGQVIGVLTHPVWWNF